MSFNINNKFEILHSRTACHHLTNELKSLDLRLYRANRVLHFSIDEPSKRFGSGYPPEKICQAGKPEPAGNEKIEV